MEEGIIYNKYGIKILMKKNTRKWFYLGVITGFSTAVISFIVLMTHHHQTTQRINYYGMPVKSQPK